MGDPRKLKNKYETPKKEWDLDRIKSEGKIRRTYGLKKMQEVWRSLAFLKKARENAMRYLSFGEDGAEQAKPLMMKLVKFGIIRDGASLDDILALKVENFLDRRLQTVVMKRGLSNTAKQARQLITHGFISVNGRRVNAPGFMVSVEDEKAVAYCKPINLAIERKEEPEEEKPPADAAEPGEPKGEAEAPMSS